MTTIKIKYQPKVFCVGYDKDADWINGGDIEKVKSIQEADIVIFPGGADIDPAYYGQTRSKLCYEPSTHCDVNESLHFKEAVKQKKFIVGICRGAQLSCVLSGGILIQHVGHHSGYGCSSHDIIDKETKNKIQVNSLHHQMMFPYYLPKDEYNIIAYTKKSQFPHYTGSFTYIGENNEEIIPIGSKISLKYDESFMEPEVVWFPKTKAFAIQCHPEMMKKDVPAVKYLNSKLLPLFLIHMNNEKLQTQIQ